MSDLCTLLSEQVVLDLVNAVCVAGDAVGATSQLAKRHRVRTRVRVSRSSASQGVTRVEPKCPTSADSDTIRRTALTLHKVS